MTKDVSQAGFSLIEIVVALAVLAVVLGTVLQLLGGSAAGADVARDQLRALTIAESRLAEIGADAGLRPGTTSGDVEDGAWQVSVTPFAAPRPTPQTAIYQIAVTASYRSSRVFLETLRIATVQP